jgi:hypothetical protein
MAGPSFLTPKPVLPSKSTRRFTVAEANRTLPLVRRIVADIVKHYQAAMGLKAKVSEAEGKELAAAQAAIEREADTLQGYVDELTSVGCQLKDYQIGLIDFVGRHRGRDVCLCWKLGDERIGYWHEMNSGYAGRQPISTLVET